MSVFKPKYDTYQDVKTTLHHWSIMIWFFLLFFSYHLIIPANHRLMFKSIIPGLADWMKNLGSIGIAFIISIGISHFMIHVLEIHDHFYDRRIIKWRKNYDALFILPRLLKPLENELPLKSLSAAQQDRRESMDRLYYDFVGDRGIKDLRNLVVRFYEVITKYWLLQIIELSILIFIGINIIYSLIDMFSGSHFRPILYWTLLGGIVVEVFTHYASINYRNTVSEYTLDQINAIHRNHFQEFKAAVTKYFGNLGVNVNRNESK